MTDDDSDSNGDGNVNAVDEETYDGRDVYNNNGNSDDQIMVNICQTTILLLLRERPYPIIALFIKSSSQ